jgi:hypothetical protein
MFVPAGPWAAVRLYLSIGDEQVPNANSYHCQAGLQSSHGQPSVIDLGNLDYHGSRHLGSNVLGTAATVRWFSRLH